MKTCICPKCGKSAYGFPKCPWCGAEYSHQGSQNVAMQASPEPLPVSTDHKALDQPSMWLWLVQYPTLTVIGVVFVMYFVIESIAPSAGVAAPGFIFELFALGAYTAVSTVYGFISIFGRSFLALSLAEKLRTLLLSILLFIPSLGIGAFIAIVFAEFIGQMQCRGGACAQGGIAAFMFLGVAWVCYFIVLGLSQLMSKLSCWPKGITPKFIGKW